ncbi:hypothetical protein [Thermomonospora umbrina]|uniref:Uncharacterized protein n=1 Tax=Thermomonospora umbrina TaxID=111806 RepID=A0A3D9SWB0_9ACTN|nr:hypothetical protein [Thermomonospora umbrina]REF00129.1 hypothetical protein DFJ69_5657 [Thermomonospora umbrina]
MTLPLQGGDGPSASFAVPSGHVADAVERVRTARVLNVLEPPSGLGALHEQGLWDFERRVGVTRMMTRSGPVDRLYAGPDVYRLLTPEEQDETGKIWRRETSDGERRDNWETERAETVASLRRLAEPVAVTVETADGERLHRVSLRIRTRPHTGDPLLDALHSYVRSRRIRRLGFEAWLTDDGELRQTREHSVHGARLRRGWSSSQYCWDFGLDVGELSPPAPDQILDEGDGGPPRGLVVLIDGEVSRY